ncbi:TLC domain-containing protein [Pleurostoma richardsiae]|uniref:TLC domain-containing protein n=1 Tax=Pleurostoma richardsiae TaxID=41990 RepID=A0AA38VZ45_9PEZI|nr:TLC domain-containing protein [Pleurostoma richardsiae]
MSSSGEESPTVGSSNARRPSPKRQASAARKLGERENMNGPLYMQTCNNTVLVRRIRRKNDGVGRQLATWFVENQIGLSFNLLALLFFAHKLIPLAQVYTAKFFSLSYYNPQTGLYRVGGDDYYLVAFYVVLFTGLRAATMEHALAPFAQSYGLSKKKDVTRFSEQAWLLTYYLVFWPLGMYLYYTSSYWMNLEGMWQDWPIREIDGLMKHYMLAQFAFWVQQVLVINIEERRKDHWQMLTHHFITIALIYTSYHYHQTRVGHVVLIIMDIVDLFLPPAKCLKYMGYTTACDVGFGIFMLSWLVCRHIFYLMVCYSVWADIPRFIPNGCFSGPHGNLTGPFSPPANGWGWLVEPFTDPEGTVCFTHGVRYAFLTFLLALQVLTVVWFTMIIRVALRVLNGAGADDVRSDDEEGEEVEAGEDAEFVYEEAQPLEEEVGVEDIDLKGWERRAGVRRQASSASTGVSLPGHSDRKELLGRIGCEKQVD